MLCYLVEQRVKDGMRGELIEFMNWDAKVARESEPGTLRFDVWQSAEDENVVYLYEVYKDEVAFEAHTNNAPFQKWIGEVRDRCLESRRILIMEGPLLASNLTETG